MQVRYEGELQPSVFGVKTNFFFLELYWVSISALWFYDYLLTVGDEVGEFHEVEISYKLRETD